MELTLDQALQQGIDAHKAGEFQDAERLYTAILKALPKHPDANHSMGVLAVGAGKVQEALPFFQTALVVKPSIEQFWLSYMDALIKLGRINDAKSVLDQAKDKGAAGEAFEQIEKRISGTSTNKANLPNPPSEQLQSIISLYTQGDLHQALYSANKMLKRFPNSAMLYDIKGNCNRRLGQFNDAVNSYKQSLKIKPGSAEAYYNMGVASKGKGDLDFAIESYTQALKLKPDFADAYNNMGIALSDNGSLTAAIESYKQALKIKPDFAEAYNNMCVAMHNNGDQESAIDNCKLALKIKPGYAEAYNNMGNFLTDKGDLKSAILNYKQAIKFNSEFAEAYNNLGNLFKKNCQYKEAKKCFDKLKADSAAIAKSLECAYHLENYREFNETLKSIAKKNPSNIRVAAMSAFASHQTKRKDIYPFCKNPIELVKISNINKHVPDIYQFINTILDEMNNKDVLWEPKNKTTIGGYRTSGNLFSKPSKAMQLLETIIQKELSLFNLEFKTHNEGLIRNWPKRNNLYGWYNRILQNGHHSKHIHPNGWVSGVFYLKTIEAPAQNEGAIEFGLHGYDYPIKDNDYPQRIYQPCDGDLVLFPSSLFHNTIPVIKDGERCVIAFDLVRQSPVML